MRPIFLPFFLACTLNLPAQPGSPRAGKLPQGYWGLDKSQPIIDKTQTVYLGPDLTGLSQGELKALDKLNEVGKLFQSLYERQRHPNAVQAATQLEQWDKRLGSPILTQNLLSLYRLNQGPVAVTTDNKRLPFLPVGDAPDGGGMYPADATKAELDAFLNANPAARNMILHPRTMVRRTTAANLQSDLSKLQQYPVLDVLHLGLKNQLQKLKVNPKAFYAVPYSLAYADELVRAYTLLTEAAIAVEKDDPEYAGFLRNRGRDLLSNDYESGDAAWVTGNFKNLNSQIGSYETYDDPLYGVKTFFSLNVLKSRREETQNLRKALQGIQALENALPYENHKRVKEDISVGVYDVISDFGQSRGGNSATILPNESLYGRRYGRTIMIRANILQNPDVFNANLKSFQVATQAAHSGDLTYEGGFYYTLWHEIGHYLGVDKTKDGEELDAALQENGDVYEEMKADLVSLFVADALHKQGYYTREQLRSVYAAGIRRVLQTNKPRRSQPYNTMQLMQWNFYLENGLLEYDAASQKMRINYDLYHPVVAKLLTKVLDIQYQGNKSASDQFIDQYTKWNEQLHEVIAKNIRDQQTFTFRLFKYAALGEKQHH
ncbi:NUDIX hydrolase [Segetibacter sp. 3557_3]|uniref:NUDIX hydrolase n=1 Tax=Segetibacter sp. 3557_3 TaxID=2547429 RepID=UPI0010591A66|nr:NUDIX hydrolase [Segetibacter sp. 3557_3]TDH24573.1 NUDIX hydrolase [Segetibacter sp. 3557_3]